MVIWQTDLYITEARFQLSDTSSYYPLDYDPTPDHQAIISQTLNNFITSGDLPFTASSMIEMGSAGLENYLLPKIHKPDCSGFVEHSLFHNYTGTIPHFFLRYIDDCISAASCSREELEQFVKFANTFNSALKFTWTISDTSFPEPLHLRL
eukprot:g45716.t1